MLFGAYTPVHPAKLEKSTRGQGCPRYLYVKRKWWNWQTHHLEGVAPKGVGVQIPPSAPFLPVHILVIVLLLPYYEGQRRKSAGFA